MKFHALNGSIVSLWKKEITLLSRHEKICIALISFFFSSSGYEYANKSYHDRKNYPSDVSACEFFYYIIFIFFLLDFLLRQLVGSLNFVYFSS